MVGPTPRRVFPFAVPALVVAALGFVIAGVLLGTTVQIGGEPRDPAPALTRPASQVVLPERTPNGAAAVPAAAGPAVATGSPVPSGSAVPDVPVSAPEPQSGLAPEPADGGPDDGDPAALVPAPAPTVPLPDLPDDLDGLVDPVLEQVSELAEGGLLDP